MNGRDAQPEPVPDFTAVLPAGGMGSRLWPLSQPSAPKFLLDVRGDGTSLIHDTCARMSGLAAEVMVVTGRAHVKAVRQQLPDIDENAIVAEPSPRDSMAAIGLAAAVLEKRHGPRVMGSFAADHVVTDVAAFQATIRTAIEGARAGKIVLVGIVPTSPSSGFGYIQVDRAVVAGNDVADLLLNVTAFTEKPDAGTAQKYMDAGTYLWNAGMFVMRTDVLLGHLERLHPRMHDALRRIAEAWDTDARDAVVEQEWDGLTRIAIDFAIAEPVAAEGGIAVVPASWDWHDVGDFASLAQLMTPDAFEVRTSHRSEPVVPVDSKNLTVVGGTKPVAVVGLDDVVVVDTDEALLVVSQHAAQQVRVAYERLM